MSPTIFLERLTFDTHYYKSRILIIMLLHTILYVNMGSRRYQRGTEDRYTVLIDRKRVMYPMSEQNQFNTQMDNDGVMESLN